MYTCRYNMNLSYTQELLVQKKKLSSSAQFPVLACSGTSPILTPGTRSKNIEETCPPAPAIQ